MFHDPVFTQAIAPDGSLSPAFSAYAAALFARGQTRDPDAGDWVDAQLEHGLYPNVGIFKKLATYAGYADFRTVLDEFTIDDEHAEVIERNRHLTLHLHTGVETAAVCDSPHFRLRSLYEQEVFKNPVTHVEAAATLIRNTRTPGMQGYLLDAYDDQQRLVASDVFGMANKAALGEYHFYDPALRPMHIGRFIILVSTMLCKHAAGNAFYYHGLFHPSESHYMWKLRMQPGQLRIDEQWQPINSKTLNYIRKKRRFILDRAAKASIG